MIDRELLTKVQVMACATLSGTKSEIIRAAEMKPPRPDLPRSPGVGQNPRDATSQGPLSGMKLFYDCGRARRPNGDASPQEISHFGENPVSYEAQLGTQDAPANAAIIAADFASTTPLSGRATRLDGAQIITARP